MFLLLENNFHISAPPCNILYQEYGLLPVYIVMCWPEHFVYQKLINRVTRRHYSGRLRQNKALLMKTLCQLANFSKAHTWEKVYFEWERPTPLEYETLIRDKSIETFLRIKRFRTGIGTFLVKDADFVNGHPSHAINYNFGKRGGGEVGQINYTGRKKVFGGQYLNYYFCPCL